MNKLQRLLHSVAFLTWLLASAVASGSTGAFSVVPTFRTAQPADLPTILRGLAERTQQYYDRFISIICTETVQQQDMRVNLAPSGRPRLTVYELSVRRSPQSKTDGDFRVERVLLSVNGRPARTNQQPGCTDPKTASPEPLGFLLAKNQSRFRFSLDVGASGGPPGARAVHFVQTPPDRVRIKWTVNCFEAEGGGEDGRLWFDPETFDVLRVDARLSKPFLVPVPSGLFGLQPAIRVERSEMAMHFTRVKFENPDETVLLPESIETFTVFRGVPSLRTIQTLSNYRRFLAESTIRGASF
jgi:hypothetical protein